MAIYRLTDDVIFAIHAEHSNVEIENFWEVARLIGHNVRKELEACTEAKYTATALRQYWDTTVRTACVEY